MFSLASTIVFPQLDYLATRRTELLWFSTPKSLVLLSNVDIRGTQNISTWQANKLYDDDNNNIIIIIIIIID